MNCHTCERELNQAVDRLASEIKEDLNFQQACAAIGRGECVESLNTKNINGPKGAWMPDSKLWSDQFSPAIWHTYKIVPDPSKQVEPPPSLTYEQALECEKVRIHWPESVLNIHNIIEITNGWDIEELSALDLAERRGYRMEKVDR